MIEDLVDRITTMEQKEKTQEISSQKLTRTKPAITAAQTTAHIKELELRMGKFQDRL
jgi:hypothetical protein